MKMGNCGLWWKRLPEFVYFFRQSLYIYAIKQSPLRIINKILPLMLLFTGSTVFAQPLSEEPWLILGRHPLLVYSGAYFGQCDTLKDCFQIEPGLVMLAAWKSEAAVSVKNVYEKPSAVPEFNGSFNWIYSGEGDLREGGASRDSMHRCKYRNLLEHFYCFNLMAGEMHRLYIRSSSGDTITESFTFSGRDWQPELEGWRTTDATDTLLVNLGTKSPKKYRQEIDRHFFSAVPIKSNNRPEYLQFSISAPFLTRDTLVEYRWGPALSINEGAWKKTAGFITVPVKGSEREWILDIRRAGQTKAKQYKIALAPRWFETTGFRLATCLCILAIGGLVYMYWNNRRLKAELSLQKQLNSQLLSMKATLTPHMILNAIAGLQDLHAGKKWAQAKRFTMGLSGLLNETLDRRNDLYCSLETELDQVSRYVALQQLSVDFDFKIVNDVPALLQSLEVPAGILQPVVENAIKYNISASAERGSLQIGIFLFEGKAVIEVESASVRKAVPTQKPRSFTSSKGIGLHWVKNRIAIHNRLHPGKVIQLETIFANEKATVRFFFTQ